MELLFLLCVLAGAATTAPAPRIAMELEELLEMIPYEQTLNLGMEYAMTDPQVKSLMQYISSDKFRDNVVRIQSSPQFYQLAEASAPYDIDVFALANKFNSALDMPPMNFKTTSHRERRSPGDGVAGLIRDVAELTPFDEMKEAYKYKVNHNLEFKLLMSKLESGEVRRALEPIVSSKPFQDTKRDLQEMGIPLDELTELISSRLHKFFDLENTTTTMPPTTS